MRQARTSSVGPRQLLNRSGDELRRQFERPVAARVNRARLPDSQLEAALVEIELACERLHDGRYGLCTQCSGPIEMERLIAHPAAARCWSCQQRSETPTGH
jgi:RNA polymerase-binding transcription factor